MADEFVFTETPEMVYNATPELLPDISPHPQERARLEVMDVENEAAAAMDDPDFEVDAEELMEAAAIDDIKEDLDYVPGSSYIAASVACITELFEVCPVCMGSPHIQTSSRGPILRVLAECECGWKKDWQSSRKVHNRHNKKEQVSELSLRLSASLHSSSVGVMEFYHLVDSIGLVLGAPRTHYNLKPRVDSVIQDHYETSIAEKRAEMLQSSTKELTLAADGKFDSPRDAQYIIYPAMCVDNNSVVGLANVHVSEAGGKSGKLEVTACKRLLDQVQELLPVVRYFCTDQNKQVQKLLREFSDNQDKEEGKFVVQLCAWHVVKNLKLQLKKLTRQKSCYKPLGDWISSIIGHVYAALAYAKSEGNTDLLIEVLRSIPRHMEDIHEFDGNRCHKKCLHTTRPESKYFEKGSECVYQVEQAIEARIPLVPDLIANRTTTGLEVFNAVHNSFLPKSKFFGPESFVSKSRAAGNNPSSGPNQPPSSVCLS